MAAKRVFSDLKSMGEGRSSVEDFIQRCKTMYQPGNASNNYDSPRQVKYDAPCLEQATIKTFMNLLSDIAVRCQSLENHILELHNQVGDLQKTVQDLCDTSKKSDLITQTANDHLEKKWSEGSQGEEENGGKGTDELKERLRRLQWKTFDMHRQNELLRRMLEIQCTVNKNATQQAAAKETEKNTTESKDESQLIQQADSTSNPVVCTATTRASQFTTPPPGEENPEYVPLSAEEMLAQSFADPKVPWSTNDGTGGGQNDGSNSPNNQTPYLSYAYAPCQTTEVTFPLKKIPLGSSPFYHSGVGRRVVCGDQAGSIYHWENKQMENQEQNHSSPNQKPHWKP